MRTWCGNPLPCGNHYCTYVCHALSRHISKSDGISRGESCEKCTIPCEKVKTFCCELVILLITEETLPLIFLLRSNCIHQSYFWGLHYNFQQYFICLSHMEVLLRALCTNTTILVFQEYTTIINIVMYLIHLDVLSSGIVYWIYGILFLWSAFRRDILHVRILAPCHVIKENALLAKHWLSVHVTVEPWCMFLSVYILIHVKRRANCCSFMQRSLS